MCDTETATTPAVHTGGSPFFAKVRSILRVERYAYTTEKTYVMWIKRYIRFHGMTHPKAGADLQVRDLSLMRQHCSTFSALSHPLAGRAVSMHGFSWLMLVI